jgi:hypothetical protein
VQSVHTSPSTIPILDGTTQYVIFQSGTTLYYFTSGSAFPSALTGAVPGTCTAVESDPSTGNVLCRIGTTLYSWPTVGAGPLTIASNLPTAPAAGARIGVDTVYYYASNDPMTIGGAAIQRALKAQADGGATLPWTDNSVGQTGPMRLRANGVRIHWLNYDGASDIGQLQYVTATGIPSTAITGTNGLRLVAPDTTTTIAYAGNPLTGQIVRASFSGGLPITVVTGIPGLTSFAVDGSYLYWSQAGDGRIFRRPKT